MTQVRFELDKSLLIATGGLLLIGLVMVCSASITVAESRTGQPIFYFVRQLVFAGIGVAIAWLALTVNMAKWQRYAPKLLVVAVVLLMLVLIPGIGREVNGSRRWLPLGPINLQVAELIKLFTIIYIADYIQRNHAQLRDTFLKVFAPLMLVAIATFLLLLQPDLGSVVVVMVTVTVMLFLGGARLDVFAALILFSTALSGLVIWQTPWRLERLQSFMDPWADPFGAGFQLVQALIAFGRGDLFGVGVGSSMQKMFYLPEAHTDFLFSILAEELGLVGAALVIILFFVFIWRALSIGQAAEKAGHIFGAQIAYGIGIWLGFQACVNIGVNMGVLPTKGLTLPLMSYGGSSLVIVCLAVALLFRVDHETRHPEAAERVKR